MTPEQTIVVSGLAAGGINLAAQLAERGPGEHLVRPALGTFLAVAALLLIGQFWPDLAAGLAVLLMVTSAVINGGPFLKVINNLIGD